jgi:hypothetical protein
MKTKHTPGLWLQKHREGSDGMYRTEIYSEEYGGIATCEWTKNNHGDGVVSTFREANARLMTAAPELLEALIKLVPIAEKMMGKMPFVVDALLEAENAIKKARGEI